MLIINGSPVVDDDNFAILKTAQIKTDATAPTDLIITTGAEKTLTLATPVYDDIIVTANNLRGGNTPPSFIAFQDTVFGSAFANDNSDLVLLMRIFCSFNSRLFSRADSMKNFLPR